MLSGARPAWSLVCLPGESRAAKGARARIDSWERVPISPVPTPLGLCRYRRTRREGYRGRCERQGISSRDIEEDGPNQWPGEQQDSRADCHFGREAHDKDASQSGTQVSKYGTGQSSSYQSEEYIQVENLEEYQQLRRINQARQPAHCESQLAHAGTTRSNTLGRARS